MRAVAFLSLIVFVYSAPLSDQTTGNEAELESNKVELVKRAKEVLMYENEQGELSDKSKRSEPEGTESTVDKQGEIIAAEPVDIEDNKESLDDAVEQSSDADDTLPIDRNMVNDPLESEEDIGSEEEVLPQNGEEEIETESMEDVPEAVDTDDVVDDVDNVLDGNGDDERIKPDLVPEAQLYENYWDSIGKGNGNYLLDLLNNQYNGWQTGGYQYPYNPIDYRNAGRYRRSRENRLRAIPKSRVLKRARRIKRDLYFASDILGRNNDPFQERYLDAPYINEEVDDLSDDDIRYLVNLLDNAERYEEDDGPVDEYAGPIYSPYADYLGSDLGDEAQFYIPKRQAGLTFVPGLKRSRDFYPYFEEPQSHFPAFVPQKRSMKDYTDAYRRLMKLAQELRAEPYYPEDEYDFGNYYKRK